MFRWKITEVLSSIPVPMLVLAGAKDIVTLPEASQTIVQAARQARLVEVDSCGHMGFMERAQVYDKAIGEFADQVFTSGAAA